MIRKDWGDSRRKVQSSNNISEDKRRSWNRLYVLNHIRYSQIFVFVVKKVVLFGQNHQRYVRSGLPANNLISNYECPYGFSVLICGLVESKSTWFCVTPFVDH